MTFYTISQACKRTGLTIHTVRHYCDLGLVPSLERDANGNRLFSETSIQWLYALKYLRLSQMSLSEIQDFLTQETFDPTNPKDQATIMRKAMDHADTHLQQLITQHDQLKAKLQGYIDTLEK